MSSGSTVSDSTNGTPKGSYANYVLLTMFALTTLNVMDRQVLSVLVEPVKAEFGLSDSQMGMLTGSAFAFANLLAIVPVGRMADVGSRAKVIAAGLFLWSALTSLTGAALAHWHLFFTRMGVGACETVGTGPAHSLLADYFPPHRRGLALSIHSSGGTVGAMAGFAVGGLLADAVGWRWTFVWFGVPGMLLALLMVFTVRDPTRDDRSEAEPDTSESPPPAFIDVVRFLFHLRSFRHLVTAGSLKAFANWSVLAWAAAAMMRAHDLSATEVGVRLALSMALFSALGLIAAGFLADRLGRRDMRWYMWLPAAASISALPFLFAFLLWPEPDLAFILIIPGAFLNSMWAGSYFAVVQLLARSGMRATAGAIFSLITSGLIGQGLGPAFVGMASDYIEPTFGDDSLRYALAIAVAAGLWGAIHSLVGAKSLIADCEAETLNR